MARTNIYFEEISDDPPQVVHQSVGDRALPFWGLRIWLCSPPQLQGEERSAVTFWFDSIASLNDFVERLYMRRL